MVIPTIHSGTPFGRPLRYRIQAMEMNVTKKNTAIGLVRMGRPESLFGPSGADQRKAQDGCQNGRLIRTSPTGAVQWTAANC